MAREQYAECGIQAQSAMSAKGEVFRPARAFLDWAATLSKTNERMNWNLSIVAAMTACEIATEKTIVEGARAARKEPLVKKERGDKDKTFKMHWLVARCLYKDLAGDNIELPEDHWQEFLEAVEHRNDVVHEGKQKESSDAKEVLHTAQRFVARLDTKRAKAISQYAASPSTPDG
jgi:hypothetical protein